MTDDRAERLLDAAAGLLVRHGYRRVTIDDVARESGVGKGTVYLHVRSKEALFVAVLLRVHRRIVAAVAERMEADPAAVLPGPMLRGIHLDLAADPVARALYLADGEILGSLAREAVATLGELGRRRDDLVLAQLTALREAGCLRTDRSAEEQRYVLGAVASGFLFVDGLVTAVPGAPARAALLEHTAAAALQLPDPPAAALAAVAPDVAAGYRSLVAHVDQEAHLRVR